MRGGVTKRSHSHGTGSRPRSRLTQDHAVDSGVGERPRQRASRDSSMCHTGKDLLAAVDPSVSAEETCGHSGCAPARRSHATASPPTRGRSHRSDGGPRPLFVVGLGLASSDGCAVPIRLADLLQPGLDHLVPAPDDRPAAGAAVSRGRRSGEVTISSNSAPASTPRAPHARPGDGRARSAGGSTTFSPSRTHSGSPWRISTISISFLSTGRRS